MQKESTLRVSSEVSFISYDSKTQIIEKEKDAEKDQPEDEVDHSCCGGGACGPEKNPGWIILNILVCIIAGVIFGWCMEKGRGKLTFKMLVYCT